MQALVCGVAMRRRQTRSCSQPTHWNDDDLARVISREGIPSATPLHWQKGHS
jgi:hypothetical protein